MQELRHTMPTKAAHQGAGKLMPTELSIFLTSSPQFEPFGFSTVPRYNNDWLMRHSVSTWSVLNLGYVRLVLDCEKEILLLRFQRSSKPSRIEFLFDVLLLLFRRYCLYSDSINRVYCILSQRNSQRLPKIHKS